MNDESDNCETPVNLIQQQSQQIHASQQLAQQQMLQAFWTNQLTAVEQTEPDFKTHTLPIARIKKVMKSDVDVKPLMISAEAPIMFAKACEIFVEEVRVQAWMHAEENKRRTIQKSDIASAVSKSDMYDFLIDIVPRDVDILKNSFNLSASAHRPLPQASKSGHMEDLYENPYAYAYHPMQLTSQQEPMYPPVYQSEQMAQYQMQMQYTEDYVQEEQ